MLIFLVACQSELVYPTAPVVIDPAYGVAGVREWYLVGDPLTDRREQRANCLLHSELECSDWPPHNGAG